MKWLQGIFRFSVRLVLLIAVPLLAVTAGIFWYAMGGRYVSTENAYVRSDVIEVSTAVDGRVAKVHVTDHQVVNAGDLLFELDRRPFEIEIKAIEAELALVRQELDALRAQYFEIEADTGAASERIRFLQQELERHRKLAASGHSSKSGVDEAEHEVETALRRADAMRQRKSKVIAELGGSLDSPLHEHPRYQRAAAAMEHALLDLDRTRVYASVAGHLGNIGLERGEQVESGAALFPLVASSDIWIEANLKEVHLTHVQVGQPAQVEFDSYPDQIFDATIESISPATGAQFSLLPPQNATGNWVKVVQWVPVRVRLDPTDHLPTLRAGLTATVTVDTSHERELGLFLKYQLDKQGIDYTWWPGE